jgi:microfibrillar-associated protein 1
MAPTATAHRPLVKPPKIRYFKGKAPDALPSSDEDDSDVEAPLPEPIKIERDLVAGGAGRIVKEPAMKVALRDVKVEGGKVLVGGSTGGVKAGMYRYTYWGWVC